VKNLLDFALQERYERVKTLKPQLEEIKQIVSWSEFEKYFAVSDSKRGRPEYDRVLMIKLLFLQSWYGISDEELEFQVTDRLSFQQFLGYPKTVPDYSTIWRFREELQKENLADKIWEELQNQITAKGFAVQKGQIQDARFVQAPPGKKNSGMENRGREAKTSRSKDGTWTKKNNKSYFGFKTHVKTELKTKIIRELAVTTASVHDNKIDLLKPGEVGYRDKAYTGVKSKALGNGSMKRGNLSPKDILRNKRISKKRCRGEHPFGIMARCMKSGYTNLTTCGRVFVQQVFVCAAYNLLRLNFLLKSSASSH
jgi:transposase, IS5 family